MTDIKKQFDPTQDLSLAPRHRSKRGLGAIPLLESEIREVQQKARSAMEAARMLGVCYNTYKKYARMYEVFEDLKNPGGIGIRPTCSVSNSASMSLESIFAGKHPNYDRFKLKRRIILNGVLEEKCALCGYEQRRITDYRVPLMLDYVDGDKFNLALENLRLICANCHLVTVGNLSGPRKTYFY